VRESQQVAWNAFQGHLDGCPISLGLRSCFKYASKVLPGSRSLEYKPLQREAVLCLPQPVVLVPRGSGACFCELLGALPPDSVDTEVGSLRGVEGGSGRLPPHRAGTLWRCPHRGWERRGRIALLLGFGNFSFCERERQTYLVGIGMLPCFLSLNIKFLPLILPLLCITLNTS